MVDVRDLADWMIALVEGGRRGAVQRDLAARTRITFDSMLEACGATDVVCA